MQHHLQSTTKKIYPFLSQSPSVLLTATYGPDHADEPDVVWTSSDEAIASVQHEGGLQATVHGIKQGSVTITVSHADNPEVYDSCDIIVTLSTTIDNILKDSSEPINVYDVSGRVIKLNASPSELRHLSNGLYIIMTGENQHNVLGVISK